MTIEITPSQIKGEVMAPPSKSMAHRLLICAALSEGESIISNIAYSEDILATIDCIKAMGATVSENEGTITLRGVSPFSVGESIYNCRESGSTLRFFIPIAMLSEKENLFTGYGRLPERPMDELIGEMEKHGCVFSSKKFAFAKNSGGMPLFFDL